MPMVMQCPFFKRECYLKLYCEGASMKFPDTEARGEYVGKYCAALHRWKECSVADMLENFYERKEENEKSYKGN